MPEEINQGSRNASETSQQVSHRRSLVFGCLLFLFVLAFLELLALLAVIPLLNLETHR